MHILHAGLCEVDGCFGFIGFSTPLLLECFHNILGSIVCRVSGASVGRAVQKW